MISDFVYSTESKDEVSKLGGGGGGEEVYVITNFTEIVLIETLFRFWHRFGLRPTQGISLFSRACGPSFLFGAYLALVPHA